MKLIKRGLYLTIFIISLFFINSNIKAYTITTYNNIVFDEEYIYNRFLEDSTYDINVYSNIACYTYGNFIKIYCMAYHKDETFALNTDSISPTTKYGCYYTYNALNNPDVNSISFTEVCNRALTYNTTYSLFSNFDFDFFTTEENAEINLLDFSQYLENDNLEEEQEELEVTIKGTEILNFMLDKTRNIYEVLIANQLFVLCSCILLSYLVFIILYKTIRK